MNRIAPPQIAVWMLERLTPGTDKDALAGDLLEEFRLGRSRLWFWRQVVAAVAIGWCRETLHRKTLLVFAAAWSMLSPAWWLLTLRTELHANFVGHVWRIPWPWSTICYEALNLTTDLIYIWAGVAVFLATYLCIAKRVELRRFSRSLLLSVPLYIVLSEAIGLVLFLLPIEVRAIDRRMLTLIGQITNVGMVELVDRLPTLVTLLYALWRVASPVKRKVGGIAVG